jgi:hypothetical protein
MRFVRWTVLLLLLAPPSAAHAQATARVTAEENFRRDPNGTQLASVMPGAELSVIAQQGGWAQVELTGWIWAPSVGATSRDGFDLSVRATGGENLRARPNGAIVARLFEGCLLERVGASASGSWIQVRRLGWLWRASLDLSGAAAAGGQPLGRTGDWIRIRLDGWVYGPAALDSALNLADTGDLTPAQLRADPARYRGALVRWRVQFISLRRAERARSDFEEGEPFIHARGAAGDAGFVYLAVPDDLLPIAESLQPLDYVTVVGRVRTGRSQLLGSPVIDLTDIEKEVASN